MRGSEAHKGFTIVELLIVMGIVLIVISLVLPAFSQVRARSFATTNMSNMRQMSIGLSVYAESYKDLPPVFGPATWPPSGPWEFGAGAIGTGNWFEHSWLYSLAVTAEMRETGFANAGGKPVPFRVTEFRGQPSSLSDFVLTRTMYAVPAFFAIERRSGPAQFAPQHFSSIAHPSRKGVLTQGQMFHHPNAIGATACCVFDLTSPVAFADQSVSEHIVKQMPRGIFNPFASTPLPLGADPDNIPGGPILDTVEGIAGVDRP